MERTFAFSCIYYIYQGVHPLVSTSLFTLKLKFCLNSLRMTPESRKKVKDTALDFAVPTGGADLRFLALQPGSAISYLFSHCFFLIMLENSALRS